MRKGVSKFLMKGIYLILVLIVISFVVSRIFSVNVLTTEEKENLRLNQRALDIMDVLTGSSECLAYEETGSVEGKEIELETHRVLDKNKLDLFELEYRGVEPSCARDFSFGYSIEVRTFSPANTWSFGIQEFSEKDALRKKISISLPVVIRYSPSVSLPGNMKITIVDGELEELVDFIDSCCISEEDASKSIYLHYPVELEENKICLEYPDNTMSCQRLSCQKSIVFTGIPVPGKYILNLKNEPGSLRIVV